MTSYEKIKIFLLGVIATLLLVYLIGDTNSFAQREGDQDRYELRVPNADVFYIIYTYTGVVHRSELSAQDRSKLFSTFKYDIMSKRWKISGGRFSNFILWRRLLRDIPTQL